MEQKLTILRLNVILAQIMESVVGTPHNSTFPKFSVIAELRHSDLKLIIPFGNHRGKLNVSKSWKQFLKLSILPKNERKTWKNYQDNFSSCFLKGLRIPIFFQYLLTAKNCFVLKPSLYMNQFPFLSNFVAFCSFFPCSLTGVDDKKVG